MSVSELNFEMVYSNSFRINEHHQESKENEELEDTSEFKSETD